MDAFRGELQKRWLKARIDAQNAKRAVCDVSYESWLTGVPDALPDTLTEESLKEATLLRDLQNVEIRSLLPKPLPKSYLNQLNVSLIDPAVTVTEIWRMLERDFGESSAAGVIGLLTKFVGTLTSDYRHVGDHFKVMSALRNRINAQSVKCFGEPIVSEQLVGALLLSLLPQQYFGSSVKFTKDSFTMDKVFQLVVNTFGSKSAKVHKKKDYPKRKEDLRRGTTAHPSSRREEWPG
ncbi:hypothetical protein DYB30_006528 [Aphanomyces astaci]|uniref:Uncharacterized protein n=1 Tax=Aphanomyces astaci TaxID=112090 RepID=A0A397D913_APHAT|nr:hypothetical protein DYB30_006528 [Aphanomyces astaci]